MSGETPYSCVDPVHTCRLVGMQLTFLSYALSGVYDAAEIFRDALPWMM